MSDSSEALAVEPSQESSTPENPTPENPVNIREETSNTDEHGTKTTHLKVVDDNGIHKLEMTCTFIAADYQALVYWPEKHGFAWLTTQEFDNITAKADVLDQHMEKLQAHIAAAEQAKASKNIDAFANEQAKVDATKEELGAHLKQKGYINDGSDQVKIVELIDLWRRKTLYAHADDLALVLSSERLKAMTWPSEEEQKEILDSLIQSKTDEEREEILSNAIIERFQELPGLLDNLKWSTSCEYKAEGQVETSKIAEALMPESKKNDPTFQYIHGQLASFDKWVAKVDREWDKDHKGSTSFFDYEAKPEVALMRYYASGSLNHEFILKEGKASLKGDCEAKVDVLDGKLACTLRIPPKTDDDAGDEIRVFNPPRNRGKNLDDNKYTLINGSAIKIIHFDFAKSFVDTAEIKDIRKAVQLLKESPYHKMDIQGHTDLVGNDTYNEALSERRIMAVDAFIRRDPKVWLELYHHPQELWGYKYINRILQSLGYDISDQEVERAAYLTPNTQKQISLFQEKNSFKPSGTLDTTANSQELIRLFQTYMSTSEHRVSINSSARYLQEKYKPHGENHPLVHTEDRSRDNRRVEIGVYKPKGRDVSLGFMKLDLELSLYAYAGANAAASVNAEFSVEKGEPQTENPEAATENGESEHSTNSDSASSPEASSLVNYRGIIPQTTRQNNAANAAQANTQRSENTENPRGRSIYNREVNNQNDNLDSDTGVQSEFDWENYQHSSQQEQTQGYRNENTSTINAENGNFSYRNEQNSLDTASTTLQSERNIDLANQTVDYSSSQNSQSEFRRSNSQDLRVNIGQPKHLNTTAVAGAELSFFAGAKAGGEGTGDLQWKPRNTEEEEYLSLARIGFDIHATAGVEFELGFGIGFQDGIFYIKLDAAIALKAGAGGSLTFFVNVRTLWDFVVFIYTQLRDANFNYLGFIQDTAFEMLSAALAGAAIFGVVARTVFESPAKLLEAVSEYVYEVTNVYYQFLEDWWRNSTVEDAVQGFIESLSGDIECNNVTKALEDSYYRETVLPYLTPEAKGRLLDTLCFESKDVYKEFSPKCGREFDYEDHNDIRDLIEKSMDKFRVDSSDFFPSEEQDSETSEGFFENLGNGFNQVRNSITGLEGREQAILTVLRTARSRGELHDYLYCMYPTDFIKECRSISDSYQRGKVQSNCFHFSIQRIQSALDGRDYRDFDRLRRRLPFSNPEPPSQRYGTKVQPIESVLSTSTID